MPLYSPPASSGIAGTLVDAKGDILVGTADDTVARKAVGAEGQFIVPDAAQSDGLKWTSMFVKPRTGDYLAPQYGATSNAQPVTGTQYFIPIWIPATQTYDRIVFWLAQVASTGTVRLGIYDSDTNGWPSGAAILDAGTVAITSGAVVKETTISQSLTPGLKWLACQPEFTGTPQIVSGTAASFRWPLSLVASGGTSPGGITQAHTGAFASVSPASLTESAVNVPIVWLRAA